LSPFIASYADRLKSRLYLVLAGGLLGAIAIAELAWMPSLTGMLFSIGLLGLAHAISVPSQLTFITETNQALCQRLGLTQVIGIFRLMERLGNILGPVFAGLFITLFGTPRAFIWLSLLIGTATLVLAVWMAIGQPQGEKG
jgi:MFS family permease